MNEIRIYKIVVVAVLLGAASICLATADTWTHYCPDVGQKDIHKDSENKTLRQ